MVLAAFNNEHEVDSNGIKRKLSSHTGQISGRATAQHSSDPKPAHVARFIYLDIMRVINKTAPRGYRGSTANGRSKDSGQRNPRCLLEACRTSRGQARQEGGFVRATVNQSNSLCHRREGRQCGSGLVRFSAATFQIVPLFNSLSTRLH